LGIGIGAPTEAAGPWTLHTVSVSHGVPVYSPPYAGTNLCGLVTEANVCEWLAGFMYSIVQWVRTELWICWWQSSIVSSL